MTEECRVITKEQYDEYMLLKKKLDLAVEAIKKILYVNKLPSIGEILYIINNADDKIKEVK